MDVDNNDVNVKKVEQASDINNQGSSSSNTLAVEAPAPGLIGQNTRRNLEEMHEDLAGMGLGNLAYDEMEDGAGLMRKSTAM